MFYLIIFVTNPPAEKLRQLCVSRNFKVIISIKGNLACLNELFFYLLNKFSKMLSLTPCPVIEVSNLH